MHQSANQNTTHSTKIIIGANVVRAHEQFPCGVDVVATKLGIIVLLLLSSFFFLSMHVLKGRPANNGGFWKPSSQKEIKPTEGKWPGLPHNADLSINEKKYPSTDRRSSFCQWIFLKDILLSEVFSSIT